VVVAVAVAVLAGLPTKVVPVMVAVAVAVLAIMLAQAVTAPMVVTLERMMLEAQVAPEIQVLQAVQVVVAVRLAVQEMLQAAQTHVPAVPAVRQETISLVTRLLLGQQLAPARAARLNWRRYEQREI
jgi:hypothetical protein